MMVGRFKSVAIVIAACGFATAVASGILWVDREDTRSAQSERCPECKQLAEQLAQLRQELVTVKAQAVRDDHRSVDTRLSQVPVPRDEQERVTQDRAAAEQQRRDYMLGVAQAFASEKVDPAWASFANSRVNAALDAGNLRDRTRTIECRAQSCRLELAEPDASREADRATNAFPALALKLADVLPRISAEHVQRGDGSRTMVLYLSTESAASAATAKR